MNSELLAKDQLDPFVKGVHCIQLTCFPEFCIFICRDTLEILFGYFWDYFQIISANIS